MALLAAAVQHGHGGVLAAEQQRADAVRAADLVPGHGHRGEPGGGEVDLQLSERLHRVGMQRHFELGCHVGQFTDRHDGADLVVGPHHGGQGHVGRVACDGGAERFRVDPSVRVHGQVLDGRALGAPSQWTASSTAWCSTGLARTRVLSGSASRRAQYRPLTARLSASVPPAVRTTSLGRAPRELGERLAGLLDGTPRPSAGGVQGRGVAGDGELGGHRPDRFRKHRGGRGVVEVGHGAPDSTSPSAVPRSRPCPVSPGQPPKAQDTVPSAEARTARTTRSAAPRPRPSSCPAPASGAPPQGQGGQDHGGGPEEDVEDEQSDEAEDERGDGHPVGVPRAGPAACGCGCGCGCGELHGAFSSFGRTVASDAHGRRRRAARDR